MKTRETAALGHFLTTLRRNSALKDQYALSSKLGISYPTLRKWETGEATISRRSLDNFLLATKANSHERKKALLLRDQFPRKRTLEGLSQKNKNKAVRRLFKYIKELCEYNDYVISPKLQHDIKIDIKRIIEEELEK